MSKDVKENVGNEQKDLNKINLIYHIIYDNDRFKMITRKYFEIFRLRGMSAEEISLEFEKFLYSLISDKFKKINTVNDVKKLRNQENSSSLKLKKRWSDMTLDSLSEDNKSSRKKSSKYLKKELEIVESEYLKSGRIISAGVKNPKELEEQRKDFLDEWKSSSNYNICDYPYLQELSISKINSAFIHDILMCITEVLKDDYDFDINKIAIKTPPHISPGIFLPFTKGKRYSHLNVKKNENEYMSDDYSAKNLSGKQMNFFYKFSIGQDENIENLKLELINPDTEKRALPKIYLDKQDLEIIRFVYTYSHMNSFSFYLGDLVKYLGLSDGKKNYINIKNRLLKLPYYTFYSNQTNDKGELKYEISFNLFSSTTIVNDENNNNRELVKITKSFIEEVERVNTDIMYRNELEKLQLTQSINLAYFLEGRRSFLISCGEDIKNKSFRYDIEDLKFDVHLNKSKTVKQNMEYLELGFNEIKENQFIIKDYKRGNSYFDVYFYEDFEKRKRLINNTILSLPDYMIENKS
ncbi:hypothetical protein I4O28_06055 [Clostridioides difficile]|uniref:hypothetical protein n=1 Tax=Clostridioides difficile TaxID=1496 RepID=UPI00038D633C|nr:hypothetical protein [Clostridioides difficile]EII6832990.1 hypothetical protein [Clostridioides difficile]EQJ88741.1 hypothetical protein QUC_3363 [Clostridioides difficile P50]MBF9984246.1 hypothetical protein [Clostridioides difficile]MBH7250181.1 hypothetical protein [Clostridioides difficile]MCE4883852.1 hypothetical protein [Clostridioides difficile]